MLQASITLIVLTIGIVLGEGTSQAQDVEEPTSFTQVPPITTILVHERVTIHNIDSDSKEDDEPSSTMVCKRKEDTM